MLVTGATGYIGGRLVPLLLERGHSVRVLVRDPCKLRGRSWEGRVEVHRGDLSDSGSLMGIGDGVEAAFYLVHSMYGGEDFAARDREAARNFIEACPSLPLLVHLGGILPDAPPKSEHLRSRAEVGAILREGLPTTELRAGPIIGSGSASFQMVRYLTERLPAMVAPRWILNEVRPIAVRDILACLVEAAEAGAPLDVMDVGGELLTFRQMMEGYARVRGLRRWILPVPVLTPKLSSHWVGLVTPIPNAIAAPLVEGVVQPVVGDPGPARARFPHIEPLSYEDAVELALEPGRLLRLRAEMRVPGRAWLQWEALPEEGGNLKALTGCIAIVQIK